MTVQILNSEVGPQLDDFECILNFGGRALPRPMEPRHVGDGILEAAIFGPQVRNEQEW